MKVWVGCARGVQVAYFRLHHMGCTLVRPSMWAKRVPRERVHVAGGVIDRGYHRNLTNLLANSCVEVFRIQKGDHIAPLIIKKHSTPPVVETKQLLTTEDGTAGFGSTVRSHFIPPQKNLSLTNQTNSAQQQSYDCFVFLFIFSGILQKLASASLFKSRHGPKINSRTVQNIEGEAPQHLFVT